LFGGVRDGVVFGVLFGGVRDGVIFGGINVGVIVDIITSISVLT